MFQSRPEQFNDAKAIDVSIIMPCLNETQSLSHCIANARLALDLIEQQYGLGGEIVIADNGSTDGSQALAESLGARVVMLTTPPIALRPKRVPWGPRRTSTRSMS